MRSVDVTKVAVLDDLVKYEDYVEQFGSVVETALEKKLAVQSMGYVIPTLLGCWYAQQSNN